MVLLASSWYRSRAILAAPQPRLAKYTCARSWTWFLAAAARATSRSLVSLGAALAAGFSAPGN
eukprot:486409-Pyramimonas_sp.AAC.1